MYTAPSVRESLNTDFFLFLVRLIVASDATSGISGAGICDEGKRREEDPFKAQLYSEWPKS